MANGHGGRRPGAGRKRKDTVAEQASRRSVVLEVFDEKAWRETITEWLLLAKETPSVIYPLLPYILGAAKQEVNVTLQVEEIAAEYGVEPARVTSIVERLKKQKAG